MLDRTKAEPFLIAYPNGAMGRTVLAHALYATGQIDIDIDLIFSRSGHAHAIVEYNQSPLACYHHYESLMPNTILEIVCTGWYEILRTMLAYAKHFEAYPEPGNFDHFKFNGFENMNPMEFLTISYFDRLQNEHLSRLPQLELSDYFANKIQSLSRSMEKNMGWTWNQDRSDFFHHKVLQVNRPYLDRLDYMKRVASGILNHQHETCDLRFWERAAIIAWICDASGLKPEKLHWTHAGFLHNDNSSIIDNLRLNSCSIFA